MSRFQQAAASGYLPPYRKQRWLSVLNTTNETIPGFACMYLDRTLGGEFFTTEAEREHVVYRVAKPDAYCQSLQDAALLIANGPMPIPRYSHGWGTQDWPAQILHDGGADRAVNASTTGPLEGSWLVWNGGSAFTVQSHDATGAVWRNDYHTLWVAPTRMIRTFFRGGKGGDTADSFLPFALPSASVVGAQNIFGAAGAAGGSTSGADNALEFRWGGTYWIAVSATVSSPDASEGDTLRMTVQTRKTSVTGFTSSYLTGYRLQAIEDDSYSGQAAFYTAENVSFQGPLTVERGEQIRILNDSYSQVAAGDLILSAHRLSSEEQDNGSTLQNI